MTATIANAAGNDDIAQQVIERADACAGDRGTLESHWEEIAERVLPNYSGSFLSRGLNTITEGEKKTDKMLDATAAIALSRFAAAMESMLTPRNSTWHSLMPSDEALRRNREVRLYFEEVSRLLFKFRYAPYANFASQNFENYLGLGAFGTGCLYIDSLESKVYGRGLRYRAIHLGEVYFLENHQGIIDTAYRVFPMTARQAAQQWGVEKLPPQVAEALKGPDAAKREFTFIHAVVPRDDYDPNRFDAKGKPWASYYVCKDTRTLISEGGYTTFPYGISRYVTAPRELYGRSPAMMALPAIKVLNEQKATVLKQGHRALDPVLLAHDDGVLDSFSMRPGALNFGGVSADGRALVQALPTGNIAVGKDLMDDERMVINDAFLVTLFQILVDTPEMTATEVLERAREKGALLSPTMGRQQSEYLAPLIDRELDVLSQMRLLPAMPPILREARGEYTVQYDSPLSKMQRAEETAGGMRFFQVVTEIAANTQDPSLFDHFNLDVMIPELAENNAMPTRWLNDPRVVQARRDSRAQAAQAQQMTEALPGMAQMTKALQGTKQ